MVPNRLPIIVKLRPLKVRAAILSRYISCVAHPKIFSPVLLFPLHHSQHNWNATFTPRCKFWMHTCFVIPIRDVDSLVPSNRMWINSLRWSNTVLPFFLHFGVHYEKRIVR